MTLPNFLGIGAPRAGTTWLNTLLHSHPDVYTPAVRDEINFFDKYYDRGLEWYATLFPPQELAHQYRAIGEITPQYLENDECPQRIFSALPDSKLIVMLRHPVARAYSQYGLFVQRWNYRDSFQDFIAAKPRSLERGFYSRYLKRYLHYFDRDRLLVLILENTVTDVDGAKRQLADFLDIPADGFAQAAGTRKVNPSSVPRLQFLYGLVAGTGRRLRKFHLEPVVDFVMRTRIPRLLAKGRSLPPLDGGLKSTLSERYRDEFDELEQCLGIDLSCWRE